MGVKSFLNERGDPMFAVDAAKAAQANAEAAQADFEAVSKAADVAIENYIKSQGLKVESLAVRFDATSTTVTVSGVVPDEDTREKVLRCCGNVAGIGQVHDLLNVEALITDSQRLRGTAARSYESRGTAFPAAVAAGVAAMCLSDAVGWSTYPPLVFLIAFIATMSIVLLGVLRDAIKRHRPLLAKAQHIDLGKSS